VTPEEHDAADAKKKAEAVKFLDAMLAGYGWRFVGSKTCAPAVIEYEIARLADDQRATVRRLLSDAVMESIADDEMRARCAARGEPYIELPVSLMLMLALVGRAKAINAEGTTP
jgi:hypothetical protein